MFYILIMDHNNILDVVLAGGRFDKNGEKKVETWVNKVGVQTVQMQFENYDSFFNVNTKENLDKTNELFKNND